MAPSNLPVPNPEGFVGIFDSGAGGLTVLAEIRKLLPNEDISYFGDNGNNPYGEKPPAWVCERTESLTLDYLSAGAKAIVIACNTATSIAVDAIREAYPDRIIMGIEPALKPASLATDGRILVLATPNTLRLDKYKHLYEQWSHGHEVVSVECPGLANLIENEGPNSLAIEKALENLVGKYRNRVDAVVLGCTHYRFAEDSIRAVLGDVPLFDGARGTAEHLKRRLRASALLNLKTEAGSLTLATSAGGPRAEARYEELLDFLLEF